MNTTQQSCLPVEVLTALYRRALAQAYLDACTAYGVETGYTLDELQMTIAKEVESYYVRQHGAKLGMDIACAMRDALRAEGIRIVMLTGDSRATAEAVALHLLDDLAKPLGLGGVGDALGQDQRLERFDILRQSIGQARHGQDYSTSNAP